MADAVPENGGGELAHTSELPAEIKAWNKIQVRNWILSLKDVDDECAQILYDQNITGPSLLLLEKSDLMDINVTLGPAKLIIHERDELIKLKTCQLNTQVNSIGSSCKPYPFNQFHAAYRYKENNILDITETGTLNLIEPCHEYKAFINFKGVTTEEKLSKFAIEVIRFSAACMNSRTNGTIHFGVGDAPHYTHGQILGTTVEDKEIFVRKRPNAIEVHFDHKHIDVAKKCIKPLRFIEVLKADMTFSGKYVIEVDIEPSLLLCKDKSFHIYNASKGNSKNTKCEKQADKSGKFFYIRDSSSSRNLYVQNLKDYDKYIDNITQLDQIRKKAEEDHLFTVKNSVQGSKLCEMLTGGSQSLDKSYFKRYILVTNKSHPVQRESLAFLLDMNFTAVLDFDPESAETGLNKMFEERKINVHLPMQYKITEPVEEIASKLKLTRTTSWVFCNGGVNEEKPSDMDNWLTEKGASIRDVVSFLCRKDVLPNKKFLVIFMLLSDVTDKHDPLLETFSMFLQELNGTNQILCICEHEKSYSYWKELIEARYSTVNISKRSVYELSFAEINGTVLSLWSENRKSSRFLPSVGGKVLLSKKMEGTLDTLSILCVNQCEGGNEDRKQLEESFYKGGKVSWWNFYFSEQPGSVPFIKRDKFDYIINTIIPDLCSLRRGCVNFNIYHLPGCGGTTLAMHVLWTLKDKFRCAVLKDKLVNIDDVAKQVIELLVYKTSDQQAPLQVLLLIDDVENPEAVNDLQHDIQICLNGMNFSKCYQVILMNCMRDESGLQTEATDDAVFIGNKLSDGERKCFEKKLEEIEQIYKDAETFYGFMILKKDFSSEYIEGVVKNTLKGFNIQKRHAQLFAVLVLLGNYSKRTMVSVSVCEEFLKIEPDSGSRKVEDEFGKLSTLLAHCEAMHNLEYDAIRVIHPRMAKHCLEELSESFSVSKAQIIDFLLTTDVFYTCVQGKGELLLNVRNMLLKRRHSAESLPADSHFSPLVQAIINETPTFAKNVLSNAAKRFSKDAVMFQLLSRYYYLKNKDFREAEVWAKKAKELQQNSSYICDTTAQVIKHNLKEVLHNDVDNSIKADRLKECLQMAVSATVAFRESQEIARKEIEVQYQWKKDFRSYNTAGCVGELQVAVMVIEILKRIPVFSGDDLQYSCNILSLFLSGNMKIQELVTNDAQKHKNASYYHVLKTSQGVTDLLYNLKANMKKHFDFLDNYFVNLVSFQVYTQDNRELKTRQKISRCFQKYVQLFCKSDSRKHKSNSALFLEGEKADTYSGLLEYLYKDNSGPDCAFIIERVIRVYDSILKSIPQNESWREYAVKFIYANIVLSKINPKSAMLFSYNTLLQDLCNILKCTISLSESMPLYFLSVMMLWPETIPTCSTEQMRETLGSNVSQLRNAFSNQMKPVCNGKRARIHFYLGKKSGYDRLISQKKIDECSKQTMTQCQNEHIWRKENVKNILCRVTGVISTNGIIADTPNKNEKVNVSPLFPPHVNLDDKVSFFIGFTMNGPVALDVQPGL